MEGLVLIDHEWEMCKVIQQYPDGDVSVVVQTGPNAGKTAIAKPDQFERAPS